MMKIYNMYTLYIFLCLLFFIFYTYFIYPIIIEFFCIVIGRPLHHRHRFNGSVTIVIAAYNEEATIGRRLRELTEQISASGLDGEVVVVSDGSADRTSEIARSFAALGVTVIALPTNEGKAAALTVGCAAARHEIIVFADTRQFWDPKALEILLENFSDTSVGGASGDLVVESIPGVMAGVGLYWRHEKWVRKRESIIHSTVGVSGSISAVRRELFRPIPKGTILDDVYWPMMVVMQGFRVVHDSRARAFDRLPERMSDEFRRKVRTLSGNFQLIMRLPAVLLPWRNPIWFQFISHKLFRLMVPWALLVTFVLTYIDNSINIFLYIQLIFYLLAIVGLWKGMGARLRVASAATSFVVLNIAAWLAFWVWMFGKASRSWKKTEYGTDSQHVDVGTAA